MNLAEFDYDLPEELIAQQPLPERDGSRMLVLHRGEQRWEDRVFRDLPLFLRTGDCVVFNDSRVFPSRLYGHRVGTRSLPVGRNNPKKRENLSGRVEVFLLKPVSPDHSEWQALVRPGRKMWVGEIVQFGDGLAAEIIGRGDLGERTLRFNGARDLFEALERVGHVPLPPYIRRPDRPEDRDRYQTVFARERGSVAAPTAGLHFTPAMLGACEAAGAELAWVTLHVGLGTFQPIHEEEVERNRLHSEVYSIGPENWGRIERTARVLAVGTTAVRAIESAARSAMLRGETDIFLYPGARFLRVGAMLTNFHLPKTSLLLLVCAFAGTDFALAAYRHAVAERYRFFSYGDCMLIL